MSTQKAKFELFNRLQALGFTYDEAVQLRRIEMTLSRWSAMECGDSNEYSSWAITRDEKTGKPYMERHYYRHGRGSDSTHRYAVADREAGALRRLAAIIKARNERAQGHAMANRLPDAAVVHAYHQSDPRGCSLHLITDAQLGNDPIDSVYTRGLAVCC